MTNPINQLQDLIRTPEAIRLSYLRSSNPSPLWLVNEIAAQISEHVYWIRRAQDRRES